MLSPRTIWYVLKYVTYKTSFHALQSDERYRRLVHQRMCDDAALERNKGSPQGEKSRYRVTSILAGEPLVAVDGISRAADDTLLQDDAQQRVAGDKIWVHGES